MKRIIAMVLIIACCLTNFSISAFAESMNLQNEQCIVRVDDVYASTDSDVIVKVTIENNPGITSIELLISYDSRLTLISYENGEAFSTLTPQPPAYFRNPTIFVWDAESISEENIKDGTVLTLTFHTPEVLDEEVLPVNVSCENVYDKNLELINIATANGSVTVIDYIPGDVNGDGKVTTLDVTFIRRYISDGRKTDPQGYNVILNESAADVNDDGKITTLDVTLIRRYISDGRKTDPQGYNVVLKHSSKRCDHTLEAFLKVEPTCTEDGNIAYWHCTKCGKYFSDENASNEISLESTVVEATGHTVVIDPAVPATYTEKGLTEGSHCSVCGEVLVAQEEYGPLEQDQYSIEYFIYGNDEYLARITIQNPNPSSYTSDKGVDWLEDLVVLGYNFEGWYDGQGSAASRVTSIPVGTARNIKLYAKWTKQPYTITFDNSSMNLPSSSKTYYVDEKITLDKPTVDRYVFLGWTTDRDELVSEIKPGTTGNFTLHSNWTSKRNLAKPVASLGNPMIVEDTIEGRILFTYEIGQVENVPLYTIKNLPSAGGVVSVYTETVTKAISTTDASTVAKAIDHITTDSTAWTLSEDWNETTHVEDSVLTEHGYDRTTGQSVGKTTSNTYTLTTNEYDNTVVKSNEGTVATTTQYNTKDVNSRETWESKANLSVSDTESAKYTTSAGVSAEVGVGYGPVSAKVSASMETSAEISSSTTAGASTETTVAHENTSHSKTGTDTVTVADNTKTTTTDKGWNKSSSSSSSSSSSLTKYEEETLSEKIANEYKYGQSYAKGGENSESAAWSTSTGESDQYSSTLTYFNSEEVTEGVSYTINGESDGSYRLVRAGVVHVFAVVIYDIANAQYSVATYAVLDDDTYTYIDYSATSAAKFDDNENGVLPFEIPIFVNDYVNGRIVASEGLKYNEVTLSTSEYEGNNTSVVIPEFFSVDNQDDTYSAYTVRNLSAETFRGKTEIKSVLLSNYIREIPASAFAGCTSLQFVYGSEINSIGDNAFSGCSSLGQFKVSSTVQSIGSNAFKGVDSIVVAASNKDVVFGAINSGAKRITINISAITEEMSGVTLVIPDSVEYFELQGERKTFTGLKIKSEAGTTVLNGITITQSSGIPLEISSESVTLNQVSVESPSYVLLLKSNAPTVSLYGTSRFVSASTNAVVCRNTTFDKINSNISSKLEIAGNLLTYGTPENVSLVSFPERGEIFSITADEYEKYIKGTYTLTLNPNGGTLPDDASITVEAYYGESVFDLLPIPVREHYYFDGWFTESGIKVTSDTVFENAENMTLVAHWSMIPYVLNWDDASNVSIEVARTASANPDAKIGFLEKGESVYYGDTLSISYQADVGYSISSNGDESIFVEGDVLADKIFASATVNEYTYNIIYKSSNGTSLGSTTITSEYGTSKTITAPTKSGYNKPADQVVQWDSTEVKTITFIYVPTSVSTQTIKNNAWWWKYSGNYGIKYTVSVSFSERTANSVKATITWTNTILAQTRYGYGQYFNMSIGNVSTGTQTIATASKWSSTQTSTNSATKTVSITITGLSATATSVSYTANPSAQSDAECPASFSGTLAIPAY